MARSQSRRVKLEKRKKKKFESGADQKKPKFAEDADIKESVKKYRTLGGNEKIVAVAVKFANVSVDGKTKKVAIKMVEDNAADKDFRRENILSLGGIIDTELGKAKITSRPSQDGVVNATLVK